MLKVVADEAVREDLAASLDEIVRQAARRILAATLEDEVAAAERDEDGRRLVVRNGHAQPRQVATVAGAVEVTAPRMNDRRVDERTGGRARFCSQVLPPWCRRSPKVTEVLPLLYLHGLSSKDFIPALEEFFGSGAGLSASAITRLTEAWQEEYHRFAARDLAGMDYVYIWADGIHFGVRLNADRVCTLVIIGSAPMARRSWSRSPTGTASPPSPGPGCASGRPAPGRQPARRRRGPGRRSPLTTWSRRVLGYRARARQGIGWPPDGAVAGSCCRGLRS